MKLVSAEGFPLEVWKPVVTKMSWHGVHTVLNVW